MDPSLTGRRGYLPREEFAKRWHDDEGTPKHPQIIERLGLVIYKNAERPAYLYRATMIE